MFNVQTIRAKYLDNVFVKTMQIKACNHVNIEGKYHDGRFVRGIWVESNLFSPIDRDEHASTLAEITGLVVQIDKPNQTVTVNDPSASFEVTVNGVGQNRIAMVIRFLIVHVVSLKTK